MPLAVDPMWLIYILAALGAAAVLGLIRRSLKRAVTRSGGRSFVSILVVAHNKERMIEGLIRGLATLGDGTGHVAHEVVVVDNHSDDQTGLIIDRLLRFYGNVRAVHMADLGARGGSAVEVGLFMCASPIVLVLNLETQVHPRLLLQAAANLLSHPAADGAGHDPPHAVRRLGGSTSFQRKERAGRSSN